MYAGERTDCPEYCQGEIHPIAHTESYCCDRCNNLIEMDFDSSKYIVVGKVPPLLLDASPLTGQTGISSGNIVPEGVTDDPFLYPDPCPQCTFPMWETMQGNHLVCLNCGYVVGIEKGCQGVDGGK